MTRAAVRNAVYEFLLGANVPNVGAVYPARAYISGEDYEQNATGFYTASLNGSGIVLVVNLPEDTRLMRAKTGRMGVQDTAIHPVALELFSKTISGEPLDAQADYDLTVDTITMLVRQNPLLSAGQVIWSSGEFSPGVKHRQSEPWTQVDSTAVFIYGVLDFEVWEWLAGTGV